MWTRIIRTTIHQLIHHYIVRETVFRAELANMIY